MKILITNGVLDQYTGTEVVTRDLALALARSGHRVAVYSPQLGPIANETIASGITCTSDLFSLSEAPDIIHGHHHQALIAALVRFPDTPAIYVCHDGSHANDAPHAFPRVCKYLAVDERCQARVQRDLGSMAAQVEIVPNAVDTDRFQPRPPLPERPRKALVFSNKARQMNLPAIQRACRLAGLKLDVVGAETKSASRRPYEILPGYDLVFAKARCALEAMAVGNAVVLCDFAGVGPYVTAAEFDSMRRKNFGYALLTEPYNTRTLLSQIKRYDPADAAQVCARVRAEASLHDAVLRWESIYAEVLSNFDPALVDRHAEARSIVDYLSRWHYTRRQEWEKAQVRRLKSIPFVGDALLSLVIRGVRRLRPFVQGL